MVFTLNQTGTSTVENKSPADLWFERKLNVNKLKTFGCTCYMFVENHRRGKMDKKSKKGIFVGYDIDTPGYRVYFPESQNVLSSSNVIFDDSKQVESFTQFESMPEEIDLNKIANEEKTENASMNSQENGTEDEFYSGSDDSKDSEEEVKSPSPIQVRTLKDLRTLKRSEKF